MTETVSNVYDLFYPSPATLKEISCNELVTALWRWKVENRVRDDFMPDLDIRKNLNPNIPSPIKRIIEECANRFVSFKEKWSVYHHDKLFFDRNDMTSILLNFYDFIFDRNGSIDYIRTAKRIMTCDRLSNDEKFKIACMYCFEDDIRRIWPSVSENPDYDKIAFDRSPELFYWVCVLRHGRPAPDDDSVDDPVDDCMFRACTSLHLIITNAQRSQHWSSVEYFWNRIRPENRFPKTNHLSHYERESFVRLMLRKLNDQQLERFVLERGASLIQSLVTKSQYKFYALPTWMYIKNKMNENNFTDLIQSLTYAETNSHKAEDTLDENSAELGARPSTEDQTDLCCEIWRTSPDKLKRSVVGTILTQRYLFCRNIITSTGHREIRFLLALLLDASFKERNGFWKNTWRNLIVETRGKDLHRIMKLCFKGENDIAEFKETSMYDHENIKTYCSGLLREGNFEDFDDILIFCCPDTQKRIDLKQRLLLSCLLSEYFTLSSKLLTRAKLLNDFINDAFDDAEVVADFKNNFMSFPAIVYVLQECIYSGYECSSDHLTRFIDTFVSNEEVTYLLKQRILEYVRNMLLDGHSIRRISADDLQTILVWCLGNEEEVTKFKKLELPMSEFFANEDNWKKCTPLEIKMNDTDVGGFLKWYFRNPEEIDEFNRLFADRFTV